jgi:hypothetical protein
MTGWYLIITGMLLALLALSIELRHKSIWEYSLERYKAPSSKLIDRLRRPNILSYRLNVYLIWPLVFVIGLVCIYIGYGQLAQLGA